MSGRCCNGACRRAQPIHIRRSALSGRFYAVTRYKEHGGEVFEAQEKHDVTDDIRALLAEAEERGAAKVRETVLPLVREGLDGEYRNGARDALHDILAVIETAP